ncbi:TetR/AcrR family transcriptional regulator [Halobacillus litoralis]|uniref:TetR/AcrR family transcriptional regulator n=1 Tax=Halobacillus litoralis TaxID=45668 RepID=UPI001CFE56C7|nr:TetR/AcrR family transcriptional regulator [Halobacillus litoralis]WLR46810.1 TetR/AcrR family transcriptional regulator [Halobacillus litoralis]
MGRKRILTKEEILKETGALLRKEGIHGVHFKKLSTELQVSRSTLYEYFKNKEDLILSYMRNMMEEMNKQIEAIPEEEEPNKKLYDLLFIFLDHAETHHIDQMIRELQSSDQTLAIFYRTKIHEDLMGTYEQMLEWIDEAKRSGLWKDDIESEMVADLIFHSILFPTRHKYGVKEMTDQLFRMIEFGVRNK